MDRESGPWESLETPPNLPDSRAQVLIQMQLLLRVQAGSREGGVSVMRGLLAAFDTLTAENHLRVRGLRLGGLGFLGSEFVDQTLIPDRAGCKATPRTAKR